MSAADDLVATAAAAHRRFVLLQDTIGALMEDAWLTYANLDEVAAARFTTAASTIVEGGLRQVAGVAAGYTSTADAILGQSADIVIPAPTIRQGVPPADVYQRSIIEARRLIASGSSYADAMRGGQLRAVATAKTDMSLGNRAAMAQAKLARPWVVGYRRTLTGKSCAFCALASTQRYTRAELLPLHPSCDCGIAEIYGTTDPGQIINRELLTDLKAQGVVDDITAARSLPDAKRAVESQRQRISDLKAEIRAERDQQRETRLERRLSKAQIELEKREQRVATMNARRLSTTERPLPNLGAAQKLNDQLIKVTNHPELGATLGAA